ncbi:MAG: hypothetical protein RIR49_534 [Actinomycetota bacterium]
MVAAPAEERLTAGDPSDAAVVEVDADRRTTDVEPPVAEAGTTPAPPTTTGVRGAGRATGRTCSERAERTSRGEPDTAPCATAGERTGAVERSIRAAWPPATDATIGRTGADAESRADDSGDRETTGPPAAGARPARAATRSANGRPRSRTTAARASSVESPADERAARVVGGATASVERDTVVRTSDERTMDRAARRCRADANIGAEPARPVMADEDSEPMADRAPSADEDPEPTADRAPTADEDPEPTADRAPTADCDVMAGTTGAPDATDVTGDDPLVGPAVGSAVEELAARRTTAVRLDDSPAVAMRTRPAGGRTATRRAGASTTCGRCDAGAWEGDPAGTTVATLRATTARLATGRDSTGDAAGAPGRTSADVPRPDCSAATRDATRGTVEAAAGWTGAEIDTGPAPGRPGPAARAATRSAKGRLRSITAADTL